MDRLLEATFFRQAILRQNQTGYLITSVERSDHSTTVFKCKNRENEQLYEGKFRQFSAEQITANHAGILLPFTLQPTVLRRDLFARTRKSLDVGFPILDEFLTQDIKKRNSLRGLSEAYESIHYPKSTEDQVQARDVGLR
ncbi:MAG: hypothetical protein Ct9H300mP19_00070 [Dehalococcoidia bacterium]|nr:MAG: hypothetical protein Ct9H300mP19_00070 [Dehalococcoidia bacterium]